MWALAQGTALLRQESCRACARMYDSPRRHSQQHPLNEASSESHERFTLRRRTSAGILRDIVSSCISNNNHRYDLSVVDKGVLVLQGAVPGSPGLPRAWQGLWLSGPGGSGPTILRPQCRPSISRLQAPSHFGLSSENCGDVVFHQGWNERLGRIRTALPA